MNTSDWTPSDDVLLAFERGELPDDEIDAVARWLETAPDGEERLRKLTQGSEDHAVQALRTSAPLATELSQLTYLTERVVRRALRQYEERADDASADQLLPIRDYQLLRELGRGAMGAVYLARHSRLQRDVAIKILSPHLAADPAFRLRFEREMAIVGQMDHPNLVRAHDAGLEGDRLFLVMELLEGADAAAPFRAGRALPVPDACEVIRQAALGLHDAHERGLVHRDVKPSNLFVTRAGLVKVIDLGLARVTDRKLDEADLSSVHTVMGTPDCMAPEQWLKSDVDRRADVYSLGCTLFMLLTADKVFAEIAADDSWVALMDAHRFKEPPSLALRRPDAPAALVEFLGKMLAKDPKQRPATALAVANALSPLAAGHSLAAEANAGTLRRTQLRPAPVSTVRRRPRRWRTLVGPALMAAGVIVLGLWFTGTIESWLQPRRPPTPAPAVTESKDLFTNQFGMEFARIPKGQAWLGGSGGKPGDRVVSIPEDFYLGAYEVTQEEWRKVMQVAPSGFARLGNDKDSVRDISDRDLQRFPVESVSWNDTQRFLEELNRADKTPEWTYRLPTVIEWEYACRGGPMTNREAGKYTYYLDQPTNQLLPSQANFRSDHGLDRPCRVGSFRPNRLGLYDMYGNVLEWCDDLGRFPNQKVGRLVRGGAYWLAAAQLVSGVVLPTDTPYHDVGLRVARVRVRNAPARRRDFNAWRAETAALPAEQQVAAVELLLRVRNPAFHDRLTSTTRDGVVTELSFFSDNVTDLEPVRGLPGLRVLRCGGSGESRGQLADLTPLNGLQLTDLDCRESLVFDLTPLAGMPLQTLNCRSSRVTDLAPLRGLPLQAIICDFQPERDSAVLRTIASLKTINGKSTRSYWNDADTKN